MAAWASAALGSSGKGLSRVIALIGSTSSGALPAAALRRVFQGNAFVGELLADGVGTGEVAGGLGGHTLLDQCLDAGIVIGADAAREPGFGRLLQQPKGAACGQQLRLERTARVAFGLARYLRLLRTRGLGEEPEAVLVSDLPILLTVAVWAAACAVAVAFG